MLVSFVLGTMGCGESESVESGDANPLVSFDSAYVRLISATDTLDLRVEVAANSAQQAQGLMERASLDRDAGMLFSFDSTRSSDAGFWMFRTRIPLDIAFLDASGNIVAIRSMEPCESPEPRWCPTYSPGAAYTGALEVNRGFFAQHGIAVGDRVELLPDDYPPREP